MEAFVFNTFDGTFSLFPTHTFRFTLLGADYVSTQLVVEAFQNGSLAEILVKTGVRFKEYDEFVNSLKECRIHADLLSRKLNIPSDEIEQWIIDKEDELVREKVRRVPHNWFEYTHEDKDRSFEASILIETYEQSKPLFPNEKLKYRIQNPCDHLSCEECASLSNICETRYLREVVRFPVHFGCRCFIRFK